MRVDEFEDDHALFASVDGNKTGVCRSLVSIGPRQEEYIEQLKFEQEEKLEREAAKRKALQQLRGDADALFG